MPPLRDIGGVPLADGGVIRTGMAFRLSGQLVSAGELEALRRAGVRLVVDLRGGDEDRTTVRSWARAAGIDYRHEPIPAVRHADLGSALRNGATPDSVDRAMRDVYIWIVDHHGAQIVATLTAIAEGTTTVFGCAAGRDRTGIVAALLHSLLGADDGAVADAYLRDAPAPERLRPQLRAVFGLAGDQPLPAAAEVLLSPRREWIVDTLGHVRARHRSVSGYLAAHGLARDGVSRLAAHLVG